MIKKHYLLKLFQALSYVNSKEKWKEYETFSIETLENNITSMGNMHYDSKEKEYIERYIEVRSFLEYYSIEKYSNFANGKIFNYDEKTKQRDEMKTLYMENLNNFLMKFYEKSINYGKIYNYKDEIILLYKPKVNTNIKRNNYFFETEIVFKEVLRILNFYYSFRDRTSTNYLEIPEGGAYFLKLAREMYPGINYEITTVLIDFIINTLSLGRPFPSDVELMNVFKVYPKRILY